MHPKQAGTDFFAKGVTSSNIAHGFTEVATTLDVEELAGHYVDVDTIERWLRQFDEQMIEELRKQR